MAKFKCYLFLIIVSTIINFVFAKDLGLRNTQSTESNGPEEEKRGRKKTELLEKSIKEEMKTDKSKKLPSNIYTFETDVVLANEPDEKRAFSTKTRTASPKKHLFYESEQNEVENAHGKPDSSDNNMDVGRHAIKQDATIAANKIPLHNLSLTKLHDEESSSSGSSEENYKYDTHRYGFNDYPKHLPQQQPPHIENVYGSHLANTAMYNPPKISPGIYNNPSDHYRATRPQKSSETYITNNGPDRNEYPYSPTYFNNWPDNAFNAHNRNMQYFDHNQGKHSLYQDIPRRNVADIATIANPFLRYYARQI